jgi:hypothetical protein
VVVFAGGWLRRKEGLREPKPFISFQNIDSLYNDAVEQSLTRESSPKFIAGVSERTSRLLLTFLAYFVGAFRGNGHRPMRMEQHLSVNVLNNSGTLKSFINNYN